jgi:hypothetical protein
MSEPSESVGAPAAPIPKIANDAADQQTLRSPPNKPASAQLTKLRDANAKYKKLLKMAKERIQRQEEEMEGLRSR